MKVILLSAGRGSRLGTLTETRPKCLVTVGEKTILDHQVDALAANGLRDITVVVGFQHEAIAAHVQVPRGAVRAKTLFNPFWSVGSSIGSVWAARELLGEPFMVINGDTIFDAELIACAMANLSAGVNLLVEQAPPQQDDMRVAVVGGRITAVGKHLRPEIAACRSLGIIACADPQGGPYRAALDAVIAAPGGHRHFHHSIIDHLARTDRVHALEVTDGRWQEIDEPEDMEAWLAHSRQAAA